MPVLKQVLIIWKLDTLVAKKHLTEDEQWELQIKNELPTKYKQDRYLYIQLDVFDGQEYINNLL